MNRYTRYSTGFILGICFEYLMRVENKPIVWFIVILMIFKIILDFAYEDNNNN